MKQRRNVYFIVGTLLVLLNLLVDVVNPNVLPEGEDPAYSAGYLVGGHFMLIIGVILLISGYRLHRKIKKAEDNNDLDADVRNIGNNNS